MNVIGSRPDGWWKDRQAAMGALVRRLEEWADGRRVTVVFERRPSPPLRSDVVDVAWARQAAPDSADDEIVRLVFSDPSPSEIMVVTSDSELVARVEAAGAKVLPAKSFRDLIDPP